MGAREVDQEVEAEIDMMIEEIEEVGTDMMIEGIEEAEIGATREGEAEIEVTKEEEAGIEVMIEEAGREEAAGKEDQAGKTDTRMKKEVSILLHPPLHPPLHHPHIPLLRINLHPHLHLEIIGRKEEMIDIEMIDTGMREGMREEMIDIGMIDTEMIDIVMREGTEASLPTRKERPAGKEASRGPSPRDPDATLTSRSTTSLQEESSSNFSTRLSL